MKEPLAAAPRSPSPRRRRPLPPSALTSSVRSFAGFPTWRRSPTLPSPASCGTAWPPTPPYSTAWTPSAGPRFSGSSSPTVVLSASPTAPPTSGLSVPPVTPIWPRSPRTEISFFQDLPAVDSCNYDWDEWRLRGCDGGRQLLSRGRYGVDLAVYDPIARTAVFLRPHDAFPERTHPVYYAIVVDEADGSFLVIGIDYGPNRNPTRCWVVFTLPPATACPPAGLRTGGQTPGSARTTFS